LSNKNKYMATILMRSYRSWDTLPEAIETAKAQTAFKLPGDNFQILGVVPNEDERTIKIFQKNGIDVIRTAKPDITEQSNIGFAAADSDYVLVFDSDDHMYPNMLLSLFMVANRMKAQVTYCDYEMWGPDGFEGVVPCHDGQYPLEEGCFITELCMYDRFAWEFLGGFDEELWRYAQWDYFLRAKKAGMNIVHVPFHGFRYRVGPSQLSSRLHRGEMKEKDDPVWEKFKKKHGLKRAQTLGHGGHWKEWEAPCPA
jgi:glycosyltransferase involved in cell wall biosynthesis